jgi:hypothetical protein
MPLTSALQIPRYRDAWAGEFSASAALPGAARMPIRCTPGAPRMRMPSALLVRQ